MNYKRIGFLSLGAAILCSLLFVAFFKQNLMLAFKSIASPTEQTKNLSTDTTSDITDTNNTIASTSSSHSSAVLQKPISLQECTDFFANKPSAAEVALNTQYQFTAYLRLLESLHYPPEALDAIGDMAGVSQSEIRNALSGFNVNPYFQKPQQTIILADNFGESNNLSAEDRTLVTEYIQSKNYDALIKDVANKKIDPTKNFMYTSVLSEIIQKDPTISKTRLNSLIEAGFIVNLDAIAFSIKQHLSNETTISLANLYSGDLSKTWGDRDSNSNLVLESTNNLQPELIDYFIHRGVPDNIYNEYNPGNNRTILDALPEPKTKDEFKKAQEITINAFKKNTQPVLYSSSERLKKWLPDDIRMSFAEKLTPTQINNEQISNVAANVRAGFAKEHTRLAEAQDIENRCKEQHNQDKKTYLIEKLKHVQSTEKLSLNNKKLIKEIMNDQFDASRKAAEKGSHTQQQSDEEQKLTKKIWDAIQDKNFMLAIELADKYLLLTQSTWPYPSIFYSAIQDKAPFNVYEALFSRNISIPDNAIQVIATSDDNLELIKKFIPYRLNLNYVDPYGENAISRAVSFKGAKKIFIFLLDQGVSIKPSQMGLDPLDIALANMDTFNPDYIRSDTSWGNTPFFVAELIKRGAPIERSHLDKISQLKVTNPAGIAYLQKLIPDHPL